MNPIFKSLKLKSLKYSVYFMTGKMYGSRLGRQTRMRQTAIQPNYRVTGSLEAEVSYVRIAADYGNTSHSPKTGEKLQVKF
jgi:hypothetical protein